MLIDYYNDLPIGRNNAATKETLMCKWNTSERGVRKIISELRAFDFGDDYIIVSLSTVKGYFRTNDIEEIKAFKKEVTNRGRHTFIPLRKVNRILNQQYTNNLQEIRKAKGITNTQAVEFVRQADPYFDKALLSKIENGRCGPTNLQLMKLAELYETTPEELVGLSVV